MLLLGEADIKVSQGKRTLLAKADNFEVEVLYLRDDDIPGAVAEGVADVGIVGENEFVERGGGADVVRRLGFGRCRLSLAVPAGADYDGLGWFEGKRIATSYPGILDDFLAEHGIRASVRVITGSVEIAPGIGLADGIFDIVSSGGTLVSNNLREVAVVMKSEALLIANRMLDGSKRGTLDELLFRIEAVKNAEGLKYVLMNVPSEHVADVVAVLPGSKSPSVMPLADAGWSAVHAVVSEDRFWEVISRLKEYGAEGILVVPVEKMIL